MDGGKGVFEAAIHQAARKEGGVRKRRTFYLRGRSPSFLRYSGGTPPPLAKKEGKIFFLQKEASAGFPVFSASGFSSPFQNVASEKKETAALFLAMKLGIKKTFFWARSAGNGGVKKKVSHSDKQACPHYYNSTYNIHNHFPLFWGGSCAPRGLNANFCPPLLFGPIPLPFHQARKRKSSGGRLTCLDSFSRSVCTLLHTHKKSYTS